MSQDNFITALAFVLRWEGGYVDHPADSGGATHRGITLASLADWRGHEVSKADLRALSRGETERIYRARYWDALSGDDLPAGLDLALFDLAVNAGSARAIRLLQQHLALVEDGRLGPLTWQALRRAEGSALIRGLCAARRDFLRKLPSFPVFGRGWLARTRAVEDQALRFAGGQASRFGRQAECSTRTAGYSTQKETTMDSSKSLLTSRTLWANAVGLATLAVSSLGYNTSGLDIPAITDSLLQIVTAGSLILSSFFRVKATRRLV